jgi:hypothetical protein
MKYLFLLLLLLQYTSTNPTKCEQGKFNSFQVSIMPTKEIITLSTEDILESQKDKSTIGPTFFFDEVKRALLKRSVINTSIDVQYWKIFSLVTDHDYEDKSKMVSFTPRTPQNNS